MFQKRNEVDRLRDAIGKASRVLAALKELQDAGRPDATRQELSEHLNDPAFNVIEALGVLKTRDLVHCEGTRGDPVSACWKLKDHILQERLLADIDRCSPTAEPMRSATTSSSS